MNKAITRLVLLLAVVSAAAWSLFSGLDPSLVPVRTGSAANTRPFSYQNYADTLRAYVDDQGMVNYQLMKTDREKLDAFASQLSRLDRQVYEQWDEKEQIALWINAYNALTLEAIINHYPIDSFFFKSIIFPKNSIRQISGVWDRLQFLVMGKPITLNEIEHQILRKEFNEPRIHMALVCAAMGCPPLRNEPFTGDRLDEQLDDQARRFLSNPEKFRLERSRSRVMISPILRWFGEDFIRNYGTERRSVSRHQTERAVLNFLGHYLDESDRRYLSKAKFRIGYSDYDWSLNEQVSGKIIS